MTSIGATGRMHGKIAVVTGGASGIGRETCFLFAAEGVTVLVTDIDADGAETVARKISENGARGGSQRHQSFIPQRYERIHSRRSPRRNRTGQQRGCAQHKKGERERQRISGLHAI